MKKITLLLSIFATTLILGQDKLTSSLGEYFDGTNWLDSSKTTYQYDDNGNLTEETEFYWNSTNWVKGYTSKYTYNSNNKSLVETYINYNSNGTTSEQYKTTNTYDSEGKLIEILTEFNGGVSWEFEDKFILEYSNSRLTGAIGYAWNGSDWVLEEESSRIVISYNANNKVSISKSDNWDVTKWVDSDRTLYTYDANNRIIVEDSQIWDGTSWSTDYKYEYTYDANGNAITEKESYLENEVLTEQPIETKTFDTSQLMSIFSHPFKDKTGIDFLFSANGIVNKILGRSSTNNRTTYYYGNEPTANVNDFNFVKFEVYPNPTISVINIDDRNFSLKKVEIYNLIGKKVLTSTKNKLNIKNLINGIYLLKVEDDKGNIVTKRIIKN
ncbi:T9SS type A sorting domain-containing protein [Polaribacter sp. Hel1_85]|uniref:T9SS type A sorting domain-containing protein n=1 Tax=Polaribacter sp. Hel1_85 TaxID=1250005 RepID=UPI00052CC5FE|nr:T9SS type A sorting domain-containing protein [Polaribacter sp. Hel1_85]KGL63904.1 hypothetical protein PHEL85_0946 [Polaribacter sp. Hel1_85]